MEAILFNAQDPYFKGAGPAEEILLDPRVTIIRSAPVGSVFNPQLDQKDWMYPLGTGRVSALQLNSDSGALEPYTVTAGVSSVLNFQSNPTLDGFIAPMMPRPLVPLSGKQAIVKVHVSASIIQVDEWWVVQDSTLTPQKPTPSPEGGSFTDADRQLAHDTYVLVTRIAKNLGL